MTQRDLVLNSTFISNAEWNKSDIFSLNLFCSTHLMARGFEGLEEVLEVVESLDADLRPDNIHHTRRKRKYSRQALRERLHEAYVGPAFHMMLVRSKPPEVMLTLASLEKDEEIHSDVSLWVSPFDFFREPNSAKKRAEQIVSFVRALAAHIPLSHGTAHSLADFKRSSDPIAADLHAKPRIQEVFWLNVYGPELVAQVGRQRMLSTPAFHLEELPGGAVLLLTRPTPADFASEEARLAQARALVHLRPELSLESTLAAWHYGWPSSLSSEQREILVRALGGWLGRFLVYFLRGRWVPRKNLEEAAVIVGDRAWLPFLRARHALQSREAPLDYSCSQFFRVAQRGS